jgi:hypothetical protein
MYFQTAGVEVSLWIPPLVAFSVSFLTSMGGVSGAFLLLPFQMSFLGYTHPSVSATNQLYNIVAIPSGVYRYFREGRMVWPLTWTVVAGSLPGVCIGAFVRIVFLPKAENFKLFAGMVLLYIGLKMILDLLGKKAKIDKEAGEERFQKLMREHRKRLANTAQNSRESTPLPTVRITQVTWKRLGYSFYGEDFDVSIWGIFSLCFIVGIVGGIYGIGGGAIIAPFFVTFFGLPIYTVAGAALMGTCVTSIAGVAVFQILAPFYPHMSIAPDWLLGILFGIGGVAGMYLGARCQKHVPARIIKGMLAAIIFFTAVKYIFDFLN